MQSLWVQVQLLLPSFLTVRGKVYQQPADGCGDITLQGIADFFSHYYRISKIFLSKTPAKKIKSVLS